MIDNTIQSFYGACKDEVIDYEQNSIKMAKLYLKYIGIKPDDRLSKLNIHLFKIKLWMGEHSV